jgi:hypothetical protein
MRTAILATTLLALAGCPSRDVSQVDPIRDNQESVDYPVHINRDLDILFVIDNSGSMGEEQASLTANFPVFIDVLQTLEGGLPNVHIGVVSSDVGAGPFAISGCTGAGDGGALLVGDAACRPTGASYLSDVSDGAGGRITNYPGSLADAFSCNAVLGTTGCGFEQHLESMRRALDGSNGGNAGFLRDDAYLAVIFIADEDDCSTADTQMFDTSQNSIDSELGYLSSFRCFEFGVDCETGNDDPRAPGPRTGCFPREDSPYMHGVQEYVDFLKSLKEDDSQIIVATIVGNPEPVQVGQDLDMPERPALVPSCQSPSGRADPAVRLDFFAKQFPNRNAFTTICNEDLSDALQVIGTQIVSYLGSPCVQGLLADVDLDTAGAQYECTVSDVLDPGTGTQEETVLPYCNMAAAEDRDPETPSISTNLPCWHLATDLQSCPDTPTNLALIVERGGANVPTGTYVQGRCVTCTDGDGNGVCDDVE